MAMKPGIDQLEALVDLFANASAKQSEQLRAAVSRATLAALQGREMTLKNIRSVLQKVGDAAGAGAAQNTMLKGMDAAKLLDDAVAGMDDALLKAVEANRRALQQFADQGMDLGQKTLKKALDDLDKFEDTLIEAVKKSASGAGATMAGPWNQVLDKLNAGGTLSGAQAATAAEQFATQMQGAMRSSRAAGLKAAQTLAESYTALVSGVLIGLSDAMQQGKAAAPAVAPAPAAAKKKPK
jgi:hypothetical protein